MKRVILFIVAAFTLGNVAMSQDLICGEIDMKHQSNYDYGATVNLYTLTNVNIDRDTIALDWGSPSPDVVL